MRLDTQLILGIAFGAALIAPPLAWADGGGQCSRQGGERHAMSHNGEHAHGGVSAHILRHLLKNKQELGLTDEQLTKMRSVALDADRAHIRAQADVMVSERELRSLLWDEKADMPAIEAKVKEYETFEATARIIGIRVRREIIGVLTPEQWAKQKALWEQHRHHDRSHMMRAEAGESMNEVNGMEASLDAFEVEKREWEGGSSAG
jgi:Spy/CpxP family protein refolding chaperone